MEGTKINFPSKQNKNKWLLYINFMSIFTPEGETIKRKKKLIFILLLIRLNLITNDSLLGRDGGDLFYKSKKNHIFLLDWDSFSTTKKGTVRILEGDSFHVPLACVFTFLFPMLIGSKYPTMEPSVFFLSNLER